MVHPSHNLSIVLRGDWLSLTIVLMINSFLASSGLVSQLFFLLFLVDPTLSVLESKLLGLRGAQLVLQLLNLLLTSLVLVLVLVNQVVQLLTLLLIDKVGFDSLVAASPATALVLGSLRTSSDWLFFVKRTQVVLLSMFLEHVLHLLAGGGVMKSRGKRRLQLSLRRVHV